MEINYVLLVAFLVSILFVDCSFAADSSEAKSKATTNTDPDPKVPLDPNDRKGSGEKISKSDSVLDSILKVDQVKTNEDQAGNVNERGQNNLGDTNSSKQTKAGEVHNAGTDRDDSSENLRRKEGGRKEKSGNTVKAKGVTKEENNGETSIKQMKSRKENSRVEDCDTSKQCAVEKSKLVACFRVAGNEYPDLSLLIQNKGKGPLTIKISAPDFVWLEKTNVQVPAKENIKVKVSIPNGGTGNLTVITETNRSCHLDFSGLTGHDSKEESEHTPKPTNSYFLALAPSIVLLSLAAILTMASAWMCISFRRKHFNSNCSKYQKLDAELPVSAKGKSESGVNDGWDNSWGDSWDDEEAPKTPSNPVTPSLSSKGLASRRLNKERWKD